MRRLQLSRTLLSDLSDLSIIVSIKKYVKIVTKNIKYTLNI